jgi:hypothetical protein
MAFRIEPGQPLFQTKMGIGDRRYHDLMSFDRDSYLLIGTQAGFPRNCGW